jgi:hypothetical protein
MVSTLRFDKWEDSAGSPFGTVLQVQSKTHTGTSALAVTANTWTTYPSSNMQLAITPRFNTSKILIIASITLGALSGNNAAFRITRDGTPIGVGQAAGTRPQATAATGYLNSADTNHQFRTITANFLDSPASSSAVTYNIDVMSETTTVLINRSGAYSDSALVYSSTCQSTITLLEIAQ